MNKRQRRYLRGYYQRHNLPGTLLNKIMKEPTMPTKINRDFYRSLKRRGLSHEKIIRMIQPERRAKFREDVFPLTLPEDKSIPTTSVLEKIYNFFF